MKAWKVEEYVLPREMFGIITVTKIESDFAALMKVERWFELYVSQKGERGREKCRRAKAMAKASAAGVEVPGAGGKKHSVNIAPMKSKTHYW